MLRDDTKNGCKGGYCSPSYLINCKIQNRVWKGVCTPALFSREFRNPNFCHLYLECCFLSQYTSCAKILAKHASPVTVESLIPSNPATRTSVIPTPNTLFFPNTASRAKILANPASRNVVKCRIPSRIFSFSRIPHCISAKSRIPKIPFKALSATRS